MASDVAPSSEINPPVANTTESTAPSGPGRLRLRILLALTALLFSAYLLSQLDPAILESLGRPGRFVSEVLNPPVEPELSADARAFIAEVKSLGGQTNLMDHGSALGRLLGRGETFGVMFSGSRLDDRALANLVQHHGHRFWGLFLENVAVSDEGLRSFGTLTDLKQLSIGNEDPKFFAGRQMPTTQVTDKGLIHIKGLVNLTSLTLDGLPITDEGLGALGEFPNLGILSLKRTKLNGTGLAKLKSLPNLAILNLDDTELTTDGLRAISGATNLQLLSLVGVLMTKEKLKFLKAIPRLNQVDLTSTGLLDEEIDAFRASMPTLKIDRR